MNAISDGFEHKAVLEEYRRDRCAAPDFVAADSVRRHPMVRTPLPEAVMFQNAVIGCRTWRPCPSNFDYNTKDLPVSEVDTQATLANLELKLIERVLKKKAPDGGRPSS